MDTTEGAGITEEEGPIKRQLGYRTLTISDTLIARKEMSFTLLIQ